MKTYKAIILGPQCSGKTTLTKYLKKNFDLPLIEEDDLFTQLNGGEYPQDIDYKEKVLRPILEDKIRLAENIIFLTSYCNEDLIKEFKTKGYKIIQLELDDEEFNKRNKRRMEEEGYNDASVWAKNIFNFHKKAKENGLFDKSVDVKQPIEDIANTIIEYLNKN